MKRLYRYRPDARFAPELSAGGLGHGMYRGDCTDFVYTVSRDFVRQCQTPVLVLPDDVLAHQFVVVMESIYLAPNPR